MTKPTSQQMIDAAEYLETETRRRDAVLQCAEVLREAGTLQARVDESERRLKDVGAKLKIEEDNLALAQSAVKAANDEATLIVRNARSEAEVIERNAHAKAGDVLSAASAQAGAKKKEADDYYEEGSRISDKMRAAAQQDVAAAKAELAKVGAQTVTARKELGEIEARLAEARAEVAKLLRV